MVPPAWLLLRGSLPSWCQAAPGTVSACLQACRTRPCATTGTHTPVLRACLSGQEDAPGDRELGRSDWWALGCSSWWVQGCSSRRDALPGVFSFPPSSWDSSAIPTYEEALTCRPAHGAPALVQPAARKEERTPPLLYHYLQEDERWQGGRRRSSSDSALFRPSPSWLEAQRPGEPRATPPPSYENISGRGV